MTEVALDLRPLQGGDRDRGVGTYVRSLLALDCIGAVVAWERGAIVKLDHPTEVITVPGHPRHGRLGWTRDAVFSTHALRSVPVHTPTLNAAFGVRPRVVTIHDAIPWRFPELYPAGRIGAVRRRIEADMARHSDRVITVSRAAADDLIAVLGVRAAAIEVIPHCVDGGWDPSSDEDADRIRGRLDLGRRYVLASGGFAHLDPRKRLEDAVSALGTLPPDVDLAITGPAGPFSAPLLAHARALGLSTRVHLTGQLTRRELNALFRGATAFVFPSMWEGFGLPLLDAFRSGVPAVVSTGGALPEVAGGAALEHPVGDVARMAAHLRSILGDPGLAAELRARGLARAATFSQAKVLAAHREVYASL